MNCRERRKSIEDCLTSCMKPVKGQELADKLNVTRQVIVKDIAILRAEGKNIVSTPQGYMIYNVGNNVITKVIPVCHNADKIREELAAVVKYGGQVLDVMVEHPVYGELKGMIMIKTMYDIDQFMEKLSEYKAEPLLVLTAGVHLHTVQAPDKETIDKIINELKEINVLLSNEDNYNV